MQRSSSHATIMITIIINGHFYRATNYTCMGSLAALYNDIKTSNTALQIKLKWKGDRGASKTQHIPVNKFTTHLKLYIIKLVKLLIQTESHKHIN